MTERSAKLWGATLVALSVLQLGATLHLARGQRASDAELARLRSSLAAGEPFVPSDHAERADTEAAIDARALARACAVETAALLRGTTVGEPVVQAPSTTALDLEVAGEAREDALAMLASASSVGRWTADDRDRLRALLARMSPEDVGNVTRDLARRLNAQTLVIEGDEAL
jgi:hypothetical protein